MIRLHLILCELAVQQLVYAFNSVGTEVTSASSQGKNVLYDNQLRTFIFFLCTDQT